jgi:YtxH-like protein
MTAADFIEAASSPKALLRNLGMPVARPSNGSAIAQEFVMLAAGMTIGAGLALLLAPKTGREMRKDLARRFRFDRNDEFAEKVRDEGGLPGPVKHIAP